MKRDCRIDLMVSAKEKELIIKKAKEKDMGISEYLRVKALGKNAM